MTNSSPPVTSDKIGFPTVFLHQLGNKMQSFIAGFMTVSVIDHLKIIDIPDNQRHGGFISFASVHDKKY